MIPHGFLALLLINIEGSPLDTQLAEWNNTRISELLKKAVGNYWNFFKLPKVSTQNLFLARKVKIRKLPQLRKVR